MPKRNRHHEAMKAGGLPPKLAKAAAKTDAAKPEPIAAPAQAANAGTAKSAKKQAKPPPWVTTPPLTPEQRRARARAKRKRLEERLKPQVPAVLEALAVRFPAVFSPDKLRPWAIGLFEELKNTNAGFSGHLLREALHRFTKTEAYQRALAAGGPRFDLDGSEQGEVTDEQKRKASEKLRELESKKGGTP